MTQKVALITGASSGIGHALAREYAGRGYSVAAIARRAEKLESLIKQIQSSGGNGLALSCDVTQDGQLEQAVQKTLEQFGRLDVAIANAGIGVSGSFDRMTLDDFRNVFETNVFGVIRTAKATRQALAESRGSLGIIGSVSGYLSSPFSSAYSSSKHAARSLAECLRLEWRGDGISVTHIAPGFIESEIRLLDNKGQLKEGRRDPIPSWLVMPAEQAARQIADALEARVGEEVITLHGKLGVLATRHTPWLVHTALRLAGSKVPKGKEPLQSWVRSAAG